MTTDNPKLPIQERLRQQADAMFFPDCLEPCTMREAAETIGELVEALEGLLRGVYGDGYVLPAGDVATRKARAILAKVQP